MIPVYKPYLTNDSLKYATEAIESTWISSSGKYVSMVQDELCQILGVKHVILTCNGTSANHLMAKALKFKHPNVKNLITPNNVYVAAWNPFIIENFKLNMVDADINTWNASFSITEELSKASNSAVLVCHNLGNPFPVGNLSKEAIVIEDNCEGFLGKENGIFTGSKSLISSVSFFGNKNITSGEGGCISTSDTSVYEYCNDIRGQGQSKTKFIHDKLGFNYRITNVQSAILYGQIKALPEIMDKKRNLFETYRNLLKTDEIEFQHTSDYCEHSYWMFGIRLLNNKSYINAERFFKDNEVEIRPMFYPATSHAYIKGLIEDGEITCDSVNNAEIINRGVIVLPSYPSISNEEINHVAKVVKEYCRIIK